MCPVMLTQVSEYRVLRFGAFEADLQARELRKQGMQIKLRSNRFTFWNFCWNILARSSPGSNSGKCFGRRTLLWTSITASTPPSIGCARSWAIPQRVPGRCSDRDVGSRFHGWMKVRSILSAIWETLILTELASLSVSLFCQRQSLRRGDIRGDQSPQPFESLLYWRWRSQNDQAFPKDAVPLIRTVRQAVFPK